MKRGHDAAAYVLGELDATATAEFERAMSADSRLRDEVERLRPLALGLERLPAEAWDPPTPPPLALPADEPRPPRVRLRLALAVAAVGLVVLGASVGALLDDDGSVSDPRGPEARIALEPLGVAAGALGTVEVPREGGTPVTVRVSGLEPEASGFYELWLLGADGELIALGSFRVAPDGTARVSLPLPVDPARFEYFDLSLEPADGDPGHSGDSVLRGPTTS